MHTCALLSAGTVKCWGYNNDGQLGNGTTTDTSTPVDGRAASRARPASPLARTHTCALLATGTVDCWGYNNYGQLGNGTTTNSSTPVAVSGLRGCRSRPGGATPARSSPTAPGLTAWGYNGIRPVWQRHNNQLARLR